VSETGQRDPTSHGIKRGVSFYSYQEEFYTGELDLRGCIASAAKIGALGIEVIPEQSWDSYPNLSSREIADWHRWLDEYGCTPVATDMFLDRKRYPDRLLTTEEGVESLRRDIDLAVKLGASVIRVIINTPPEVVAGAASYAQDHGVRLAVEVHSPMRYDHRWVLEHLEVIHRVDNGYLGLLADMSTFVERLPRVVTERALRDGATPALVDHIKRIYQEQPSDLHTLAGEIAWRGGTPADMKLVGAATWYSNLDPAVLLDHIPYLFHIQAKFYEMTDELVEYSIPYDRLVDVLVKGGYAGYLSSEYEGSHYVDDIEHVSGVEQVRRQHLMFERLLGQTGS
jgi:sugar phosphate isomerase/epimerase